MTNTFIKELENMYNTKNTENSALAYKSTLSKVYDMFAFGGAYRNRSDEDVIKLFKDAYEENPELALKCLFYLGDIRGCGQGERRFFDVCFKWLCQHEAVVAECLIPLIAEYRRWDEVVKTTYNTPCWDAAVNIIKNQLYFDIKDNNVSLCAKWMPSENASSKETKKLAAQLRTDLDITAKQYRKMLSHLRAKIKLVESQMSQNRWNEIEFDKLPSKAGFKYRAAFARNPETTVKYRDFINSKKTKVNAGTLYPYEIVRKARYSYFYNNNEVITLDKYWNNLKDYFNGADNSIMCVCDFSSSMAWGNKDILPIDVSLSLGLYTAERMNGPFKNHFISFSNRPQFHEVRGNTIVKKVNTALRTAEYANTNLPAVFDLFYNMIKSKRVVPEDLPKTLIVISDMEIDAISTFHSKTEAQATMDTIANKWAAAGLRFPNIVYWNVNARNNTILQEPSSRITYVSGCSPAIFTQVLAGKNGIELMLSTIDNNPRYEPVKIAYTRAIASSYEF